MLPGARRFKDLGVTSTKDLEVVEPLRLEVRTIVKPELTGGPDPEVGDGDSNLRLLRQRGGA